MLNAQKCCWSLLLWCCFRWTGCLYFSVSYGWPTFPEWWSRKCSDNPILMCCVVFFFFFFVLLHTDILPTTIQSSLPWYVLSSLSSCKDGQWVYTYSFFPRVGLLSLQCIFLHCLRLLDFAFCLLIMQPPIFRPKTADLKTFCFSSFDNKLLVYHKYSCIIVSMVELVSSVSLLEIVTFHYELIMLLR